MQKLVFTNDGKTIQFVSKSEIWKSLSDDEKEFVTAFKDFNIQQVQKGELMWKK